ncbi:adaptin family protein [Cryptosporidium muris RN66]|uniref:Adaptin family protein n=1 Tax=Cryptosporidium muris (strain RN66) TaxID=441375 RepID=B6AJI5_CRYMR|nr:adaptin family protein [Cryptosporidium muris RN66]EEA08376.1 adaptin family protein [Cryptosporidium muris RN66]|eukprot:XP_002142725.1 adaptin family protein [Cryptosporidium muris RN66]
MRQGGPINYGGTAVVPNISTYRSSNEFFVDHRRGEVKELFDKLKQVINTRDREKRIEVFQKVIAYITLGIDVSSLYSQMVLASATQDPVEKKIVYLYLTHYAESNSELALLTINTLRKDCQDEDPVIRCLALRSFCSLRIPISLEYIEQILINGLNDHVGYVRKTAIMGCLKYYHYAKDEFKRTQIQKILNDMIYNEIDPQASINLVYVLNEINLESGGLFYTKHLLFQLLNRIKSFNEWGQFSIFQLTLSYIPTLINKNRNNNNLIENSEENQECISSEIYDILNLLDDRSRYSSATVLLTCTQLFLYMTKPNRKLYYQVIQRLKGPLITIASTSIPEISYIVYIHLRFLFSQICNFQAKYTTCIQSKYKKDFINDDKSEIDMMKCFENEFRQFFVRCGDPSYIKSIKLDLIVFVSSQEYVLEIIEELYHCVYELKDTDIAPKVIYSLSLVFLKYMNCKYGLITNDDDSVSVSTDLVAITCINYLCDLLLSDYEDIVSSSIESMEMLLQIYPSLFIETIRLSIDFDLVYRLSLESVGITSLCWIIGQFIHELNEDAILIFEYIADNILNNSNLDNYSNTILPKLLNTMLISCCRIFFFNPAYCQDILGELFSYMIEKCNNPDIKDQALFYYRLLQYDYELAKEILSFNGKTSEYFNIDKAKQTNITAQDILTDFVDKWNYFDLIEKFNTFQVILSDNLDVGKTIHLKGNYIANDTVIDSVDTQTENRTNNEIQSLAENNLNMAQIPNYCLKASISMQPNIFEEKWDKLSTTMAMKRHLKLPSNTEMCTFLDNIENDLVNQNIYCMASGQFDDKIYKMYIFCTIQNFTNKTEIPCFAELIFQSTTLHSYYMLECCIKASLKGDKNDGKDAANIIWNHLKIPFQQYLVKFEG